EVRPLLRLEINNVDLIEVVLLASPHARSLFYRSCLRHPHRQRKYIKKKNQPSRLNKLKSVLHLLFYNVLRGKERHRDSRRAFGLLVIRKLGLPSARRDVAQFDEDDVSGI